MGVYANATLKCFVALLFVSTLSGCQTLKNVFNFSSGSSSVEGSFQSPDGYFQGRLPGFQAEVSLSAENDYYHAVFSRSEKQTEKSSLECYAFKTKTRLASVLASLNQRLLQSEPTGAIQKIESRVVGQHPSIGMSWKMPSRSEVFRVSGWDLPYNTVYCLSENLDAQDFDVAIKNLIFSMEFQMIDPPPHYRELLLLSVNQQPWGYVDTRWVAGQNGEALQFSDSVLLIPRSNREVMAQDHATAEWSDAQGLLLNTRQLVLENGEQRMDLSLEKKNGRMIMSGEFFGKSINHDFGSVDLVSSIGQTQQIKKKIFEGNLKELVFAVWEPDMDPMNLSELKIQRLSSAKRDFRIQSGALNTQAQLDAQGLLESKAFKQGQLNLELRRVSQQGHAHKR